MKKLWVIIILCIVAFANAYYLTTKAYELKNMNQEQAGKIQSFCDFNKSFACSPVLLSPYAQFFGVPFPAIAMVVYPILAIVTLLGLTKVFSRAYPTLAVLSALGFCFNGYYIFQEAVNIGSFCPLCLLCTGIIILIFILSFLGYKERKNIA
jgi:uncharacterized membrane protein